MSNFRIKDGVVYISKAPTAVDTNNGTEELPKRTITGAAAANGTGKKVLGTAIYAEAGAFANLYADQPDGVILDGINKTTNIGNVNGIAYVDLTIWRYARFLSVSNAAPGANLRLRIIDCLAIGPTSATGTYHLTDSIIVGVPNVYSSPIITAAYTRCVFVGCASVYIAGNGARDTFFDEETNLSIHTSAILTNCNIAGSGASKFSIGGVFYSTLDAAKAAYPSMFVNCTNYSTDNSKFNNPGYMDFSLKPDSPFIGAGTNGVNITGQPRAQIYSASNDIIANGEKSNLFIDPVSFEWFVGNGGNTGVLTSLVEDAGRTRQMSDLDILGLPDLIRNVPSTFNNLVNYNPLTVEMRWSMGAEDINLATWKPFRLGVAPSRNTDGKTNGEAGYNWSENIALQYSKRQFRITLRKDFIQQ